jgi:glycosyltransferase involved in cell wall biosynthesis
VKLIYVANARLPSEKAHAYQILKTCEAFARNGARVELIVPFRFRRGRRSKEVEDYWRHYGVRRIFKIVRLPSLDLIWLDQYTTKLSSIRFLMQASSFAALAAIYALFKEAEVLYTRERLFAFIFSSLKVLHRKKVYYEAHTFNRLVSKLVREGSIDGVIAVTSRLKEFYVKDGAPEEKVLVAPDAVDLGMFDVPYSKEEARRKLCLPVEGRIIGYVGQLRTMDMEKGVWELLEAFKRLKERSKDLFLCLVGGLEDEIREYEKLVRREGLEKDVILVGHRPPYEVPLYLKAFDICVMPSPRPRSRAQYLYYMYYTSPLKLFEYMASRRPIVAPDLPTVREILNEENAVLVKPGEPEALAEGLEKTLKDEGLANKVAEKAYEDVQEYSWERRAIKILNFIGGGRNSQAYRIDLLDEG